MSVQVIRVGVLNGQGKRVKIEGADYHTVVEDVVVLPTRGKLGEKELTSLSGRHRSRAIENQKNGKLQDDGDLFPTE